MLHLYVDNETIIVCCHIFMLDLLFVSVCSISSKPHSRDSGTSLFDFWALLCCFLAFFGENVLNLTKTP